MVSGDIRPRRPQLQAEDEAAEVLAAEACVEVSKWPGAEASGVITDSAN